MTDSSRRWRRYALAAALAIVSGGAAMAADPPLIARLVYTDQGATRTLKIRLVDGPVAGGVEQSARPLWSLLPGDVLKSATPPPDRQILFFQRYNAAVEVVCAAAIRFYPVDGGWLPRFRLDAPPPMVWNGRAWSLARPDQPGRSLTVVGSHVPNADGYYTEIQFGSTGGDLRIDGWELH